MGSSHASRAEHSSDQFKMAAAYRTKSSPPVHRHPLELYPWGVYTGSMVRSCTLLEVEGDRHDRIHPYLAADGH